LSSEKKTCAFQTKRFLLLIEMDLDFGSGFGFRPRYLRYNESSESDSDQEKLQNDNNETKETQNNSLLIKILDSDDQIDENSIPKVELKNAEKDLPNVREKTTYS
jgi:hypothetical protein